VKEWPACVGVGVQRVQRDQDQQMVQRSAGARSATTAEQVLPVVTLQITLQTLRCSLLRYFRQATQRELHSVRAKGAANQRDSKRTAITEEEFSKLPKDVKVRRRRR
jgi:hypothetical protein